MPAKWRRWSGRATGRWGKNDGRGREGGLFFSVFWNGETWGDVQELGDDGGRGDLDQDDVIESDAVERVEQREAALDLVRFDHALEDVLDRDVFALACQVVRDGEDGPEIVGWVAPCKDDDVRVSYSARGSFG